MATKVAKETVAKTEKLACMASIEAHLSLAVAWSEPCRVSRGLERLAASRLPADTSALVKQVEEMMASTH